MTPPMQALDCKGGPAPVGGNTPAKSSFKINGGNEEYYHSMHMYYVKLYHKELILI
jgi:hypothetical protein